MIRQNGIYGLMAGITIGFAVWGAFGSTDYSATSEVGVQMQAGDAATVMEVPESLKNLHAQSAVLIDGDSGRLLFGKSEDEFRPMASTTKIMTCILALEMGEPDQVCTVSGEASSQPQVHLGAIKGTEFRLEDLLYSLMLESHNDTAVMIAEAISGSVKKFAEEMNHKARQIGCVNTCFLTPNGLDSQETMPDGRDVVHGTTAYELALIMRYCVTQSLKKEEFMKITRTQNHTFTDLSGRYTYSCSNHNALLTMMSGVLSGKTGFTGKAGYTYVAAIESEGRTFIIALLGAGWPPHKTYKWSDVRALAAYGEHNYHYRDVWQTMNFSPVTVEEGVENQVPVTLQTDESGKTLKLLLSDQDEVDVQVELPESVEAPVTSGDELGHVDYFLNGNVIRKYPICARQTVAKRDYRWCLKQMLEWFLGNRSIRDFS
ncbi:MAG: D-alanyl-D-alanine carboxypeptidase [Clostridiales bacterium]|nr:D-alanyl-D-alanine carboxypeptidase [Clostridiales bacterium]